MSVFGLAKSQPAEPAQKGHVLVWPPEHFTVVYTLCTSYTYIGRLGFEEEQILQAHLLFWYLLQKGFR